MSLSEPTVCVVTPTTRDRDQMLQRSVACFRAQTFKSSRRQIVWLNDGECSVGRLLNEANAKVKEDIIVHFDSDDVSSPTRIAEQVALLISSGAECVGYNEILFWDTTPGQFCGAWHYHNRDRTFACGTSLCYWRKTWERVRFPDLTRGEDTYWIEHGVKCLGVSGIVDGEPRLIATLHAGNTGSQIVPGSLEWQRAPEYDVKVREIMERA